jgi:hypothetical protein
MARNGKIARLPQELREELNRRLAENEPGAVLLKWLNELPAMRALLEREYGGKAVSKQNLCQWRAGGFAEWQARREILGSLDELTAEAEELTAATDGRLTAHLATVLAGRYAAIVAGWNGEMDETIRFKIKVLHGLCRDVAVLRQGEIREARRELKEERKGNPKSEEPKSERRPKTEIRRAGGPEGGPKTGDKDEHDDEEDALARQEAVKAGQGESNPVKVKMTKVDEVDRVDEEDLLARQGAVKAGQSKQVSSFQFSERKDIGTNEASRSRRMEDGGS